ncbi:uncharacterized protein PSFLO_01392 [Pseudozyma flocculosa]|uniref:Uncharacterized protein n=1 Tax=Pseudozyma flocculosa TaxID=84751 RepID=A0A5C3EXZ7_9BASI|nr:uncharacterized protein PSFLO_01392 [Pseudozyma flocculosa]
MATLPRPSPTSFLQAPPSTSRARQIRSANCLIASSLLFLLTTLPTLFGALDYLLPLAPSDNGAPSYLVFPHSLAHFLPLLIPLTTYIVIARWTGEKHFRHS